MTVHAFVDETKHRGFVMVEAVIHPRDLAVARTTFRGLCLPGQPRLHFTKERPSRRAEIAAAVAGSAGRLDVYDAREIQDLRKARTACLGKIATNLVAEGGHRLVIEQDDSLVLADCADLYAPLYGLNDDEQLSYEHVPARSEPLLWIPDAAAWCWPDVTGPHPRAGRHGARALKARNPAQPPSGGLPGSLPCSYCRRRCQLTSQPRQ